MRLSGQSQLTINTAYQSENDHNATPFSLTDKE